QAQFEALCGVIDRPDLPADPRFAVRQARLAHRVALKAEIEAAVSSGHQSPALRLASA
ncbi:MAG: CoA transferase, partial [Rubrivivax sp.]